MTDISIIILNYNTRDLLAQTLNSINRELSADIGIEIIVSDNGSTDGSIEMIQSNFPWVRLLENNANLGFSAGNNRGVPISKGRYVLFLNSDVQVVGDAIQYVYKQMEADASIGIGTCYVELSSGGIDPACHRGFPTPWRAFCYYSSLEKFASKFPASGVGLVLRKWLGGYHLLDKPLDYAHEIDSCTGAFLLVRRDVGEQIKWWDEDFFMYGEDLDFCYKVKELGKKVMFFPQVKILHFKHQSGLKKNDSTVKVDVSAIKRKTTTAFYDAMNIFYTKHYATKYPGWLTGLVLWFVSFKKQRALQKIHS